MSRRRNAAATRSPASLLLALTATVLLALPLLLTAGTQPALADIHLAVAPAEAVIEPGDTLTVELTITETGSAFNAYAGYVAFDKTYLTFLQMDPITDQEGPLMTEACPNRFHQFSIEPDSSFVTIFHSLLCEGTTVTGPGVIYYLRFQAGPHDADTEVRLLENTTFYDDGLIVTPLHLADAHIQIGEGLSVPDADQAARLSLSATPNPFNPVTVLSFVIPDDGWVSLRIVGVNGHVIRSVIGERLPAGRYTRGWDGTDDQHRPVGSGTYLAVLEADDSVCTRSVTLVK